MDSEKPPPPNVEVLPAAREQEPVLANLLELYAYDLSEVFDLQLQSDGRFGYPALSRYWEDERRFPFLVRVDGAIAGFVLIARGSHVSGDPQIWDVAEFFVLRRYRQRGVGRAAAAAVWQRCSGIWEVRVAERNHPARAFWTTAIKAFAGAYTEEGMIDRRQQRWRVFSFRSPGREIGG